MNFIAALIDHVPELRSVYSEHIEDYDEVLPHVFMGDVTRFIAQQLQTNISDTLAVVRRILDVLERGMISGDDSVQEIISVSFAENVVKSPELLTKLEAMVGPALMKEFQAHSKAS